MPSSSGPVSWLINGYHRHADPQAAQRFVCDSCQAPAGPSRRQRLLASLALLAAFALVGWWLYRSGLIDGLVDGLVNTLGR
jgi:ferric-dicitrate binding protein FerR (iron transport regulator)